MTFEITNTDSDLVTFASERVGDLDRLIRDLTDIQADIWRLDDDLTDDAIDPDDYLSRLMDRLEDSRNKALVAYQEAKAAQERS
jgi:hypothetical protein